MYDKNSFVTLTYDNKHLPPDGSLNYKHFQDFLKRLRKQQKIRFYMCGEYGENMGRPHYHAILFNCHFQDQLYFKTTGGFKLYTSNTLNKLWPLGQNNLIGAVSLESAGYVTRYCTKVITGDLAKDHYAVYNQETGEIHQRQPEFCKSSNRPGIGAPWLLTHLTDVYPSDQVITNGKPSKPPRYYDTLLKRIQTDDTMGYVEAKRYAKTLKQKPDNSPERMKDKEQVQRARLAQFKRTL